MDQNYKINSYLAVWVLNKKSRAFYDLLCNKTPTIQVFLMGKKHFYFFQYFTVKKVKMPFSLYKTLICRCFFL